MRRASGSRSGFSLIEIAIVMAISAVIAASIFAVLGAVIKGDDGMRTRIDMHLDAAEVVRRVAALIKNSGPAELGAADNTWSAGEYPVFTKDSAPFPQDTGVLDPDFLNVGNAQITPVSSVSDPEGYGERSVEMAFRIPKDSNGDKYPTTPVGEIEWGDATNPAQAVYFSLIVTPGTAKNSQGVFESELQLRSFNGEGKLLSTSVLATGVERISFQTSGRPNSFYQSPDTDDSLGPNQVRITVWFLRRDANGKQVKMNHSMMVNFRSIQR